MSDTIIYSFLPFSSHESPLTPDPLLTDLQRRNSELVEENQLLRAVIERYGTSVAVLIQATGEAVAKHPTFPKHHEGIASRLGEEVMEFFQAVNDHCEDGAPAEDVWKELTHVGAVVLRALNVLESSPQGNT
ncbi:hypothetical protein [Desulfovibrio inopinatus]|uniref:hypothetical protein n=1 Tax=Desulfovibrio inopinatus TaxID=102109 RepID=UPI00040B8716|nr:hypothetical protein [Desulfovibrio inopinatus]